MYAEPHHDRGAKRLMLVLTLIGIVLNVISIVLAVIALTRQ